MYSFWDLLKESFGKWQRDKASSMAAAIAYYTLVSMAPLLIAVVAIAGVVLGKQAAQGQLVSHLQPYVGPGGANLVQNMVRQARQPGITTIAGALSGIVLLFGASGVFSELQGALNTVWDVPPREGGGVAAFVKGRVLPFLMILVIGLLLLAAVLLTAAVEVITHWVSGMLPVPGIVVHIANFVVSFAVITVLFAMLYDILPGRRIPWSDVWIGAAYTSLLFTIGKTLLAMYLGHSTVGSAYGAAGSVVVFVVWIYYSAQIFLLGAEFSRVYSRRRGSRVADRTFTSRG